MANTKIRSEYTNIETVIDSTAFVTEAELLPRSNAERPDRLRSLFSGYFVNICSTKDDLITMHLKNYNRRRPTDGLVGLRDPITNSVSRKIILYPISHLKLLTGD